MPIFVLTMGSTLLWPSNRNEHGHLAYSYDTVGSRVSETRDGLTSSYSYTSGSNRLAQVVGSEVTDFSYDAVGNTTAENDTSFSYDQSNRVTSVAVQGQNAAQYSYDSRNLRVKRTTDGKTSYAAYDQAGRLIAEIDDQGQLLYEYVYLDATLLNMFSYVEESPVEGEGLVFTGPVLYYFVNDHLGTPQMVVDGTGQIAWQGDYLPFGEVQVVVDLVGNSIRFPGQYLDDETGLHYNWNRYYNPAIGRYISADPIGLQGGINLFAYVGGDPVNWVDPMGLKMDYSKLSDEDKAVVLSWMDKLEECAKCDETLANRLQEVKESLYTFYVYFAEGFGAGGFNDYGHPLNPPGVRLEPRLKNPNQKKNTYVTEINIWGTIKETFFKAKKGPNVGYYRGPDTLAHELLGHGYKVMQGDATKNERDARRIANKIRECLVQLSAN